MTPKPPSRPRTWRDRLRAPLSKIQPVVRVVERAGSLAVHLQKVTPFGVLAAASGGVAALHDMVSQPEREGWVIELVFSKGATLEALQRAGAYIRTEAFFDGTETHHVMIHGQTFVISNDGNIVLAAEPDALFLEWLRQVVDHVLPPVMEVFLRTARDVTVYESRAAELRLLPSTQGPQIWAATKDLLDGGRCVLFDGRPGVGKTTKAQEVAALAGLGRVVFLPNIILGPPRGAQQGEGVKSSYGGTRVDTLRLLSAGVIVVDDVDKVEVRLPFLEALRGAAKLVILTANNGQHDEVLDAAIIRAGRIDEVFSIEGQSVPRRSPFDRLTDEQWEEVRDWPVAYLNEVEKRLLHRPDDLRLDDIRGRVDKKTRSGTKMY